jgi:Family of unknown function (DUF5519)
MELLNQLVEQISSWPGVSVHPHRFGGKEFCFGHAEIGHIHPGGILDIPMPRAIHDALLKEGLAEEHHWVPNSGWITYRMKEDRDLKQALWLARLSYLRYALKTSADPQTEFEREVRQLQLSPSFTELLEKFVPGFPAAGSPTGQLSNEPNVWWQLGL